MRKKGEELTPTAAIDNGWHEFIMFGLDYERFCRGSFGAMIYHQPFTRADKANARGLKQGVSRDRAIALIGEVSSNWNGPAGLDSAYDCTGDCCPIYGD